VRVQKVKVSCQCRRRRTKKDHSPDDITKDIEFHATRSRWSPMGEEDCQAVLRRANRQRASGEKLAEEAGSDGWRDSGGPSVRDRTARNP